MKNINSIIVESRFNESKEIYDYLQSNEWEKLEVITKEGKK
ncbi:hypothetical protein [Companilactobacillus sp. FL22-1]